MEVAILKRAQILRVKDLENFEREEVGRESEVPNRLTHQTAQANVPPFDREPVLSEDEVLRTGSMQDNMINMPSVI